MMKKLFLVILVIFYSSNLFASTAPATIKIYPNLNESQRAQADTTLVCSNRSTKTNRTGTSKYEQCIKMYEFKTAMRNYFRDNIDRFKNNSAKVKMLGSKGSLGKADYMMFCGIGIMVDELKTESGFYKWDDQPWYESRWQDAMAKGIYYMQLNCKIVNIETGVIIHITEGKTKLFTDNGLATAQDLIKYGKELFDRKFPKAKELEGAIERDIKFTNATFNYIFDDEDKKYADGQERGKLELTGLEPGYLSNNGLTEFTLTAKQGLFTKDMSKSVKFTDTEFKDKRKLSFRYQTYDCQDKKNANKYFETFNLQITNQLTQEKSTTVKEYQAPFECLEPYFTVTTTQKTTTQLKPIENYRGISETLKSFEEDKDTYYIFVDIDKGKIEQLHIDDKSTRKIHREAYVLNMKSCKYEVKKKDELVKNLGGSPILKSEDEGWGFDENTTFYVDLEPEHKPLTFKWKRLRKNHHYSNSVTYKKKIPQLVKDMFGKVNDMTANYRNIAKNSKEIEIWKAMIEQSATPQDVKCGGKVSLESMLIPPLDATQDPKVEFKIKIRPSTKSEIKIFKRRVNTIITIPNN